MGWPWVGRRPRVPQARHLPSAGKSVLRPLFHLLTVDGEGLLIADGRAFSPLMDTFSVTFQLVSSLIWETPPPTHSHHFLACLELDIDFM